MKRSILIVILAAVFSAGFSQKYITKNGHISFYSETPIETIEAHNRQVNSALDAATGDFVFKVLMRSFEFEKALMEEHFNENYIESEKFPNAIFKGRITNIADIDFNTPGSYNAEVEGTLVIHGVEQKIRESGRLEITSDKVRANSKFILKPADYRIKIPNTVVNNIAEEIEVTVDVVLEEFKK